MMKIALPQRHATLARRSRGIACLASLVAFGTVAWEHLLHVSVLSPGDRLAAHLIHALRDGFLALPLALVAVIGGLALAQRVGLRQHRLPHLLGRATLIALGFALLLVPSVALHERIDRALMEQGQVALAVAVLEGHGGLGGLLLHGVRDALGGLVIAWPLSILGVLLLAGSPAAPSRRQWLPRAAQLVPVALVLIVLIGAGLGRGWLSGLAQAAGVVDFIATDEPGPWFQCVGGTGCVPAGTQSLAVVQSDDEVQITVGSETNTVHTFTSLLFPTGARHMPFDQDAAFRGTRSVTLKDSGLYVFVCKLHPFMLAAVIVDDPGTAGLDLGENITLINSLTVPTSSDLATRLLRAFFLITNPANYQDRHPATNPSLTWTIAYPEDVPLRITGGAVVDLKATLEARYGNNLPLEGASKPSKNGVGEVWIDTEFEKTANKTKPGTVTAVDPSTWVVTKKVALPGINLNNPHNMWTDIGQTVIYQTQWFDTRLTVFDRVTGALVQDIDVGESPAHVMTRVDTDQVHVGLNGEDAIVELSPFAAGIERRLPTQFPGELPAHPHGHWMSFDGHTTVTPNSNTNDSTQIDVLPGTIAAKTPTGTLPIASGMMPDASKYYVSNYLDSTITCISIGPPACKDGGHPVPTKTINLLLGGTTLANYDPIGGAGFSTSGALPIQTPVSPNGKYIVTANTLTGTITIIDTDTDELIKVLPCSAGCHGVNFGAKRGGGYYAYIASKFSNDLIIVDPDPDNDGDASDATIAGRVVLVVGPDTAADDTVTAYAGMGGQGVLPIPLVYHGWVQKLPEFWKKQLTSTQQSPIP
jgi:DNA-binding beta-propeller fold protein YncE